ncbi:hypothetical protein H3J60_004557 [Salmonella enterica]|nr:hypothetical protein [Salmonella enterica]
MKINKDEVKTAFASAILIVWAFLLPPLFKHFNSKQPGEVGPEPYFVFMPVIYLFSAFFIILACYFLYDLIKNRKHKMR